MSPLTPRLHAGRRSSCRNDGPSACAPAPRRPGGRRRGSNASERSSEPRGRACPAPPPANAVPRPRKSPTAPVASFPPNRYRLHDMAGSGWESTSDWYSGSEQASLDPNASKHAHSTAMSPAHHSSAPTRPASRRRAIRTASRTPSPTPRASGAIRPMLRPRCWRARGRSRVVGADYDSNGSSAVTTVPAPAGLVTSR
jgi:hypothetical protein